MLVALYNFSSRRMSLARLNSCSGAAAARPKSESLSRRAIRAVGRSLSRSTLKKKDVTLDRTSPAIESVAERRGSSLARLFGGTTDLSRGGSRAGRGGGGRGGKAIHRRPPAPRPRPRPRSPRIDTSNDQRSSSLSRIFGVTGRDGDGRGVSLGRLLMSEGSDGKVKLYESLISDRLCPT